MRILFMGDSPSALWAREFVERLFSESTVGVKPTLLLVEQPSTQEQLASLLEGSIEALILLDHVPFGGSSSAVDLPLDERVRHEARRAIFALELARHAARTQILVRSEAAHWPVTLAALLAGSQPADRSDAILPTAVEGAAPSAPPDTPLIATYLDPLFAAAADRGPLILTWRREYFLDGDAPNQTLPAIVEIAGRARHLAYGPYLPLPAGPWRATATLGFSPDIGNMPFLLEADTGDTMTRGFFEVDRGGIFRLELDFEVVNAMHPVEFRLISQDSALEGQVALIEIVLEQTVSPQATLRDLSDETGKK
jgi:hypothetical protein